MERQILNDENLLSSLELEDLQVSAYLAYRGSNKPKYYFFYKGELLFEGNDYRPSMVNDIDSLECMVGLLGFLTLKQGDVSPDFFHDYTPHQLAWCETFECDELRLLIGDFEMDGEEKELATKRLESAFAYH